MRKFLAACGLLGLAVLGFLSVPAASSPPCWAKHQTCPPTTTTTTTALTTTTAPTTTTVPTTTTATTTTSSTAPTFASETAYTQTRPAFTPTRTVSVNTASGLKTAIANLQPGDYVKASAPFTVSSGTANALLIANRLSAPAVIDLAGVNVVYTGTGNYSAVWVRNVQNVRIYGGDLSMSQATAGGGTCVTWTASQHSMWWGFYAHDCGSGGLTMFTGKPGYSFAGPVEYDDVEGEVGHFSLNHGLYDNHTEKCSGLHGANLADGNYYAFDHNRVALNVHDSVCTGGGVEFGSNFTPTTSPAGVIPNANTIILKCANLMFVSTIQTGGNCYQTWGYGNTNTDLKYLAASNLTGHAYWAGGMYAKPENWLKTDTVEYGRATSTDQNPRYAKHCTFNSESQTVFGDVAPSPCLAPFTS